MFPESFHRPPDPSKQDPECILAGPRRPLFGVAGTRSMERAGPVERPGLTLMQRAGESVARLALALAPHANAIWLACGPGNNGGDGLVAATWLHQIGKAVTVTWLGDPSHCSADTLQAFKAASAAGVPFAAVPPEDPDLCIDALLGIGARPVAPSDPMAQWISRINAVAATVLSVDLPSGLDAYSGQAGQLAVRADHTIALLTLKPGYFMASGRDLSGTLWFDALGCQHHLAAIQPDAWLSESPAPRQRAHQSHKGLFGDVTVIGGAPGMTGAALLAGTAALHAGAGRVMISLLANQDARDRHGLDAALMLRSIEQIDLEHSIIVCGCGGGPDMASHLPRILRSPAPMVIDADALNAIAEDATLQRLTRNRRPSGASTVLTPHPLEAARLLSCSVQQVQADRLYAAHKLASQYGCVVVLKGSGSLIAAPEQPTFINPTGNGRLATAGSGDVLAGMIGAELAQHVATFEAARRACFRHGALADAWAPDRPLTADLLSRAGPQ